MRLLCLQDKQDTRKVSTESGALLVCSSLLQELTTPVQKSVRPGFGTISTRHNLTRYARQTIREVGAVIDSGILRNTVFLTGTLPGSTTEALDALAAWSAWAVGAVLQWVRDYSPTANYFGVWEYQKRGALHLHVCIQCQSPQEADNLKRRWKDRWILVLRGVARRSGVDVFRRDHNHTWADTPWAVRTDAQTVEKSVACYLAKYLSKGSAKNRAACYSPPSAWWFAKRQLTQTARNLRRKIAITHLSLAAQIDLFERVGAVIAEQTAACFSYQSAYDFSIKGLVALLKPIQASLLFDDLKRILGILQGTDSARAQTRPVSRDDIRIFFRCTRDSAGSAA